MEFPEDYLRYPPTSTAYAQGKLYIPKYIDTAQEAQIHSSIPPNRLLFTNTALECKHEKFLRVTGNANDLKDEITTLDGTVGAWSFVGVSVDGLPSGAEAFRYDQCSHLAFAIGGSVTIEYDENDEGLDEAKPGDYIIWHNPLISTSKLTRLKIYEPEDIIIGVVTSLRLDELNMTTESTEEDWYAIMAFVKCIQAGYVHHADITNPTTMDFDDIIQTLLRLSSIAHYSPFDTTSAYFIAKQRAMNMPLDDFVDLEEVKCYLTLLSQTIARKRTVGIFLEKDTVLNLARILLVA